MSPFPTKLYTIRDYKPVKIVSTTFSVIVCLFLCLLPLYITCRFTSLTAAMAFSSPSSKGGRNIDAVIKRGLNSHLNSVFIKSYNSVKMP